MSLRSGYAASGITDFNKIKWALQILCPLAIAAAINHLTAQWLWVLLTHSTHSTPYCVLSVEAGD